MLGATLAPTLHWTAVLGPSHLFISFFFNLSFGPSPPWLSQGSWAGGGTAFPTRPVPVAKEATEAQTPLSGPRACTGGQCHTCMWPRVIAGVPQAVFALKPGATPGPNRKPHRRGRGRLRRSEPLLWGTEPTTRELGRVPGVRTGQHSRPSPPTPLGSGRCGLWRPLLY